MSTSLTLQNNTVEIVKIIEDSNKMYLSILFQLGLPSEGVLSTLYERQSALRNLPHVLIELENRGEAHYLSKFLVAVSTGLFDAALNYLWDETIEQLRIRVRSGDLNYFYALVIPDYKIKDFTSPEDLVKIDDATLIDGALKTDIISYIGFKHLDYIRSMRNWASAAHPNQSDLSGLNLVSWLETCIREVIGTPVSCVQIRINQLLKNIKTQEIDAIEAQTMSTFFLELVPKSCDALAKGLFAIYIDPKSTQQTILNIHLIAPSLWEFVSEAVRSDFGVRCTWFMVNGEQHSNKASMNFLELVGGLSYLPDAAKTPKIKTALDQLLDAHNAPNNFYYEPALARNLANIIGKHGEVPKQLNYGYIKTLITVFITNGSGEAWDANPVYIELIKQLDTQQTYLALTSFRIDEIQSKLQFPICKNKYKELLDLLEPKITSEGIHSLLDEVRRDINKLSNIASSDKMMKKISQFDKQYNAL